MESRRGESEYQRRGRRRGKVQTTQVMLTYAILAIVAINAAFVTFMIIWEADYVDWFHSQCDHSCNSKYISVDDAPLLIISLSGFSRDYLNEVQLTTLNRMKKCGASAERVVPSFPLKTFPNFATLVTGFFPGQHGIGADTVYMPNLFEKPVELKMNTSKEYFKKEPIWSLFKKAKMGKVASFFWKGPFAEKSEYETPDYHMNFDPTATDKDQLDQIVKWLRKPKETRPNLVMVNFDHAKYIGFHHKTKKQLHLTLRRIDSFLGTLFSKLHKEKILHCTNVAVVSDNGMTRSAAQVIFQTNGGSKWTIEAGPSALLRLRPRATGS
ncbi:hypothetical protein Y032_0023g801 [Ancylostoma ceylanicum]|nr:hypothetical protein Y032_0023g801 [Ancylostoma ceylanicum]